MPPLRTNVPAYPTQTILQENQERAYIAASRRCDRSLEARVKSARKASEMHKNRTGRSLQVTDKDVLEGETYEEEHDDMHAQYKYMAALLRTGSLVFVPSLAAYLRTHRAMRGILESTIQQSYQQQLLQTTEPIENNQVLPQSSILSQAQQQQISFQQDADSMLESESQNLLQNTQQAILKIAHLPTPRLRSTAVTTSKDLNSLTDNSSCMIHRNIIREQSMSAISIAELPLNITAHDTPRLLAATIAERRSLPTPSFALYPQIQLFVKPEYSMSGIGYNSGSEFAPHYDYNSILAWTTSISESNLGLAN